MKPIDLVCCAVLGLAAAAYAQSPRGAADTTGEKAQSIEGFWLDVAGRTLFKRDASPTAVYGGWHSRDVGLPYFEPKHITRSGSTYILADLRFGNDYTIKVLRAAADRIEFVRSPTWSGCRMHFDCRLSGDNLLCSVESVCREAGKDVLDWQGEERYERRSHCERTDREQALGIPTRCR